MTIPVPLDTEVNSQLRDGFGKQVLSYFSRRLRLTVNQQLEIVPPLSARR